MLPYAKQNSFSLSKPMNPICHVLYEFASAPALRGTMWTLKGALVFQGSAMRMLLEPFHDIVVDRIASYLLRGVERIRRCSGSW